MSNDPREAGEMTAEEYAHIRRMNEERKEQDRQYAEEAADNLEYYDPARPCDKCGNVPLDTALVDAAHSHRGWTTEREPYWIASGPKVTLLHRRCIRCKYVRFEKPLDRKAPSN